MNINCRRWWRGAEQGGVGTSRGEVYTDAGGLLDDACADLEQALADARYGQNGRTMALGRKNYLFMGSACGGRGAAIAYTLIETAKLNDIDPQAWPTRVLERIPDYKINRIDELLPWNCSTAPDPGPIT